jgi:hypothetical protein
VNPIPFLGIGVNRLSRWRIVSGFREGVVFRDWRESLIPMKIWVQNIINPLSFWQGIFCARDSLFQGNDIMLKLIISYFEIWLWNYFSGLIYLPKGICFIHFLTDKGRFATIMVCYLGL